MFTTTHRSGDRRISSLLSAVLLAAALLAFPACDSSSGGGSSTLKFTVSQTTPADGAAAVSPDAFITVRFSADLAGQTVTDESFQVMTPTGEVVTGTFDLGPRVATFRPHTALPEEETLSVTLTDAIASVSGVPLQAMTFTFTTAKLPPQEEEPLTVIAANPAPFAQSVTPDAVIEIDFSDPVEADSVDDETVRVTGSSSGRYPVTIEIGAPTATSARIISGRSWLPGETITVSLLEGIVAVDEIPFNGFVYTFRVQTIPRESEFEETSSWVAPGVVRDLRLGDLDGDGYVDLVYYVEDGSSIEAVRQREDGTFSFPIRVNVGQRVTALALADLDGDGDQDLVVGSPDRAYTYRSGYSGFALTFSSGEQYISRSTVHDITVAEIDRRGDPDVVLSTSSGVQVFLAGGGSEPIQAIGGTRLAHTPIRCVDLDLDGRLDLVFGTLGFNLITYHLAGSSPGEFGEATSVIISSGAADVQVDDFTGDGRPDLLALLTDGDPYPVALLRQFGDLDFMGASLDIQPLSDQSDARMTLADLEGDVLPGILLTEASGAVSYLAADTSRTPPWSEAATLHVGPGNGPVRSADLDRDGRLDVAFASGNEIHFLVSAAPPPPPPPAEPDLDLSIDRVEVRQGDIGATSTVRLTHSVGIEGATILVGYDPQVVTTPTIDFTGGAFDTVEFTTWDVVPSESLLHVTALVDVELPLEGLSLAPADNRSLFRVRFDVPAAAPLGESALDFVPHSDALSLSTAFIVGEEMLPPTAAESGVILVQEPLPPPSEEPNQITVATVSAPRGAHVRVPVIGDTERELQGFTVVAQYDAGALTVEGLDLSGSFTETLSPDFVSPTIRSGEGYFFLGVAFDLLFEGEPRVIPPGEDYVLFYIEVEVRSDAPSGHAAITLTDGLGNPPLDNLFTSEGQSFFPRLVHGGVQVLDGETVTFVRGDSNDDANVDVSDPIFLTGCLFNSRPCPDCRDAADVNDDGRLDIADSIFLLNYVFRGGQPPPSPGPFTCGIDPTEDDLPCTNVLSCN